MKPTKAIAALVLVAALSGCKKEVCVKEGLVKIDDYITTFMPFPKSDGSIDLIPIQQYTGSHMGPGCLEWREVEDDSK